MECLINIKCILVGLLVMTMILLGGVFADCGPLYNPEEELVEPTTKTNILWVGNLGSVSYPNKSTAQGSLAEFKCEKGFYVKGNKFAVCEEDRKWHINHRGLECNLIECEIPSDIEHGNITYYRAVHGEHSGYSQYKVACNDGYRPKNPMIRVCLNNGTDTQKGIWSYVDESEKLIIGDTTPECIKTKVDCNLELGFLVTFCVGFILLIITLLLVVLKLRKRESQCGKKSNADEGEGASLLNMPSQPPTVKCESDVNEPTASTTESQLQTVLSNSGVDAPCTSTAESQPPPVLSNSGVNESSTSTTESQRLDALNTIENLRIEKDALELATTELQKCIDSQEKTKKAKKREIAVLDEQIRTKEETLDSYKNTLEMHDNSQSGTLTMEEDTSQPHLREENKELQANIIKLEEYIKRPCLTCVASEKDFDQEQYKKDRLVTSTVTIGDAIERLEKYALDIKLNDGENGKQLLLCVGEIKGIVKVTDINKTSISYATNKDPLTGASALDSLNDDTEDVERLSDYPGSSAATGGMGTNQLNPEPTHPPDVGSFRTC